MTGTELKTFFLIKILSSCMHLVAIAQVFAPKTNVLKAIEIRGFALAGVAQWIECGL